MRVIHHNGRATPLRHPLWDTSQARRAHLLRITPHIPHRTGNIIILHDGSKTVHRSLRCLRHYTMGCSVRPIGRPALLVPATSNSGDKPATSPSTPNSDTVALHGPDPPGETPLQRCGETHLQRVGIRDPCQPHAHLSHGSAILPQGSSGTNASLELRDENRNFKHPDHTAYGQEINATAPYQVQTGVCPQSRPTFTQQAAVVRATQSRTAIAPAAVIPHHFLDAENAFF